MTEPQRRPSDQALLTAMKRDMDDQISRLNDNRVFLIATVQELQEENLELRKQLSKALSADAGEPVAAEPTG